MNVFKTAQPFNTSTIIAASKNYVKQRAMVQFKSKIITKHFQLLKIISDKAWTLETEYNTLLWQGSINQ